MDGGLIDYFATPRLNLEIPQTRHVVTHAFEC